MVNMAVSPVFPAFFATFPTNLAEPDPLAPTRRKAGPARGLAGGTPIEDLGFRGAWRSYQKRRKSRRLGDGAQVVKPAGAGRPARVLGVFLAFLVLGLAAGAAADRAGALRVGTSADYAPFSHAKGERAEPEGFDVALLRAWAADRGRKVEFVRFRWPKLVADLEAGRFDVAASGITVLPERSAAGRFTVAVAETEAFALARGERSGGAAALDDPEVKIAVNAGGHLEQVARASFPRATLIAVPDNDAVIKMLLDERVEAVVTDGAEAPVWEERAQHALARIGPLSRDRKAWLVRADQPELAADLDAWLIAREADGTLSKQRAQWLRSPGAAPTAEPLRALLAALDERLALMPVVGVVKRRDGVPLVVPEREKVVIDRALADVRAEAKRIGRPAPEEKNVRALFEAQLEAARQVQWSAVKDPAYHAPSRLPDLERELRPSLLRIGERTARLLLALPDNLDAAAVRAMAGDELRSPYLAAAQRDALADAIAACTVLPAGDASRTAPPPGPAPIPDRDRLAWSILARPRRYATR
jgi:cyclohexadienyl dehydratase